MTCTHCPENLHITRFSAEHHVSQLNCSIEVVVDPVAEQEKLDTVVLEGVRRDKAISDMQAEYRAELDRISRNSTMQSRTASSQIVALEERAFKDREKTASLQQTLDEAQRTIAQLKVKMQTLENMITRIDADCLLDDEDAQGALPSTRRRRLGSRVESSDRTSAEFDSTKGLRDITVLHPCYGGGSVALGATGGETQRGLEAGSVAILTVFSMLLLFAVACFLAWHKAKTDPKVAKVLARLGKYKETVQTRWAERGRQSWGACCFRCLQCRYRCTQCRHKFARCCFVHCFTD